MYPGRVDFRWLSPVPSRHVSFEKKCCSPFSLSLSLGPVVRKPIIANPRVKVNRGFLSCLLKMFLKDNFKLEVKKTLIENLKGYNILGKSLLIGNETGIKLYANPELA